MNHYIISSKHTNDLIKMMNTFDIGLQNIKNLLSKKDLNKIKKSIGFLPSHIYVNCEKDGLLPNGWTYTTKDMRSVLGKTIDGDMYDALPNITIPFYGKMIFELKNSSYERCNNEWKVDDITEIHDF